MGFNKAISVAFRVTLFNGSRDNAESKEPRVFIGRVSIAQLLANHLLLFLLCHVSNCKTFHAAQIVHVCILQSFE